MVACDCSVTRIIFGPEGEVLDVGRKTRVWSTAQRRAITSRDRHCQGKGCHAPARDCDIHHVDHWANGGTTSTDKGKLLCRPCHTTEHLKDGYRRRRRHKP
ncbi:MAG TPA: HNH endonuclease signature motif containing protein [Acidimicrobiia bacterium]|nr:HNH endonuclease signature motif containing protein [Acidimicrobiia bacterium]